MKSSKKKIHPHEVEDWLLQEFQNPKSDIFKAVVVYDGICGIGKTTDIIDHINNEMNKNIFSSIIYVGMYIDELHRISETEMDDTKASKPPKRGLNGKIIYKPSKRVKRDFVHPETKPSKLEHLKSLIRSNKDIVVTHKLFSKLDREAIELIKERNYHLIIDEEPSVVELIEDKYSISFKGSKKDQQLTNSEISELLDLDVIKLNGQKLMWGEKKLNRYADLKQDVENGRIHLYNSDPHVSKNIFVWMQNPEVFTSFKTVNLLTYLFKGSYLQGYFEINRIPYFIKNRTEEEALNDLKIKPYYQLIKPYTLDPTWIPKYGSAPFCSSWYDEFIVNNKVLAGNELKTKLGTYFKSPEPYGLSKDERLWTCFKKAKSRAQGKGYTGGFVAYNKRATNKYRKANRMAFAVDVYANPILDRFMIKNGFKTDPDAYATSVLIQWIFRGAIRDGKPIQLFLPSPRMSKLLKIWISNIRSMYKLPRVVRDNIHSPKIKVFRARLEKFNSNKFIKEYQPGLKTYSNVLELLD